jgi:hypothetical protein
MAEPPVFGFFIGAETNAGARFRFKPLVSRSRCFGDSFLRASVLKLAFSFFQFADSSILFLFPGLEDCRRT